jgi:peptidoglycan/xylan/chitin deacetylase (PgdA/CDA1 family)
VKTWKRIKNVDKHTDTVRKVVQSGRSVGVHIQKHLLKFPFSGLKKVKKEITGGIIAVEKATGQKLILFRPPFGVMNPVMAKAVRYLEPTTAGWSVRSFGY